MACLISFSGIDSAGKSTYINYVKDYFDKNKIKYKVIWSRGGYTNGFEALKKLARKIAGKRLPESGFSEERTEMLQNKKVSGLWYTLAMIDLIRLYAFTLRRYRLMGYYIICDRYIWDTYVDFSFEYKDHLKGFLWKLLEKIYCKPRISFYLFISPEESLRRSDVKKEAFSEPLNRRIKRMEYYNVLIKNGKWTDSISTEEHSIDEVKEIILKKIENEVVC